MTPRRGRLMHQRCCAGAAAGTETSASEAQRRGQEGAGSNRRQHPHVVPSRPRREVLGPDGRVVAAACHHVAGKGIVLWDMHESGQQKLADEEQQRARSGERVVGRSNALLDAPKQHIAASEWCAHEDEEKGRVDEAVTTVVTVMTAAAAATVAAAIAMAAPVVQLMLRRWRRIGRRC